LFVAREQVDQGNVGIATAKCPLSSVNRTMVTLRVDQYVKTPVRAGRFSWRSERRFALVGMGYLQHRYGFLKNAFGRSGYHMGYQTAGNRKLSKAPYI
jgi:hypothetical protein